jgi:DNA-binding response OmpR family regulator
MTTVLILDDNPTIVQLLNRVLSRNGYSVRCATDCGTAIARLDGVAVAIVDVSLGCCSGHIFADDLLRLGIPVILTSGDPARVAGWHGPFLPKPWDTQELLALLRPVAETRMPAPPFGATSIISLEPI